jgi:hypothetical protein
VGLVERKALKRCQDIVAPYADSGEAVEDFDVGYIGRTKIDLIATDRTLWLFPSGGGDLIKLPYTDISSVTWQRNGKDGVLGIATRSGQNTLIEIRAPRRLAPDLERRVSGLA